MLAELPTRDERELVVGSGEGGDDTTAIDAAAEQAVVSLLDSSGVDFALVSEELGHRAAARRRRGHGRPRPDRRLHQREARHPVLLAVDRRRRGPDAWPTSCSATSTTSARGRSGRRCAARARRLERRSARTARCPRRRSSCSAWRRRRRALVARARAVARRASPSGCAIMGSLALSLCHLAAGRVDAVASLRPVAVGRHRRGAAARA